MKPDLGIAIGNAINSASFKVAELLLNILQLTTKAGFTVFLVSSNFFRLQAIEHLPEQ